MSAPSLAEAARGAFAAPFDAVLELRPDEGAPVFIDGRKTPPAVSNSHPDKKGAADCVWRCPADIMLRVLTSRRAVENAVISGRLVIAGDMSVMARLELAGG